MLTIIPESDAEVLRRQAHNTNIQLILPRPNTPCGGAVEVWRKPSTFWGFVLDRSRRKGKIEIGYDPSEGTLD